MRSPPIERARVVGREGRQAAGLECSLYSDHKPLKQKEKKEKSEERQLHSLPCSPSRLSAPPPWAGTERDCHLPACAKQPGAVGLSLSVPSGCYGSCLRKPLLPTTKAFSSEPGGERLAVRLGSRAQRVGWRVGPEAAGLQAALSVHPGPRPGPQALSDEPFPPQRDPVSYTILFAFRLLA